MLRIMTRAQFNVIISVLSALRLERAARMFPRRREALLTACTCSVENSNGHIHVYIYIYIEREIYTHIQIHTHNIPNYNIA